MQPVERDEGRKAKVSLKIRIQKLDVEGEKELKLFTASRVVVILVSANSLVAYNIRSRNS